jgi:hypothetical protein
LIALCIGLARIVTALVAARAMRRKSRLFTLPVGLDRAIRAFAARHRIAVPAVRTSPNLICPAVVGFRHPLILVPEDFHSYTETEARSALLHECAHIRRHDYALNLLGELLAMPLIWHPGTHFIRGRIAAAREMACDRMASAEMASAADYARCLISLASKVTGTRSCAHGALALFGREKLESRVIALMNPAFAGAGALPSACAAAAAVAAVLIPVTKWHVGLAWAQTGVTSAAAPRSDSIGSLAPETLVAWQPGDERTLGPVLVTRQPTDADMGRPVLPVSDYEGSQKSADAPDATGSLAPEALIARQAGDERRFEPILVTRQPTDAETGRPVSPMPNPEGSPKSAGVTGSGMSSSPGLRLAGLPGYSAADVAHLQQEGVGAAELAAFARSGYSAAAAESLIRVHDRGALNFVVQLRARGYEGVPPDSLAVMWDHGVSVAYVERLRPLGYGNPRLLVQLRDHGVPAEFVEQLRALGYDSVPPESLIQMWDNGVRPAYIQRLRALGYEKPAPADVLRMWYRGIGACRSRNCGSVL